MDTGKLKSDLGLTAENLTVKTTINTAIKIVPKSISDLVSLENVNKTEKLFKIKKSN